MKFHIITLFPEMFDPLNTSILKRAREKGLIDINLVQLRDFATDKHKTVDDTPYGGGAGMVVKVDVADRAITNIKNQKSKIKNNRIVMLSASGQIFNQQKAIELAKYDNVILLCGHYEGFDQRVHDYLVDEEISIGEYVLTGGELPAMVVVDAVSRMIPGVIKEESMINESFMSAAGKQPLTKIPPFAKATDGKQISRKYENTNSSAYQLTPNYDYPQYTRPEEYKGMKVPKILLSGNHPEIAKWRSEKR